MTETHAYICDGCGTWGFTVKLCPRCGGTDTCRITRVVDRYCRYYESYCLKATREERGELDLLPAFRTIYGEGVRWPSRPGVRLQSEVRMVETTAREVIADILAHCEAEGVDVSKLLFDAAVQHANQREDGT